ncbi:hypothetical protein, partial [Asticcacaulis sp.]|uniref:hypothetical protein n=1 Tax=Asticcacaulis sp. TaxID=1872648 RepID=UPI002608C889
MRRKQSIDESNYIMEVKCIHEEKLSNIQPYFWYGNPVFQKYEQILAIVSERISDEVGGLFSTPAISDDALATRSDARWIASADRPVVLTRLTSSQRAAALEKLAAMIKSVLDLAAALRADDNPEVRQLGELLPMAIEIPGPECVYVDDRRLILACWGFYARSSEGEHFRLIRYLAVPQGESGREVPAGPSLESASPPSPAPVSIVRQSPDGRSRRWLLIGGLLAALLVLAGLSAAFYFLREQPGILPAQFGLKPPDPTKLSRDETDPLKREIVSNRVLVTLKEGVAAELFVRQLLEDMKPRGLSIVGYKPEIGLLQLEFQDGTFGDIRRALEERSGVDGVAPETVARQER